MAPQGPYISPWTKEEYYIISSVVGQDIVYVFVANGKQASEGMRFPDMKAVCSYISDNGFNRKEL